jgi:tetratricopeptide (TPR) repeat protein
MRFVSASNPLTIGATRRRATLSLLAAAVMALSPTVWAATSDEAVVELQQAWELINYRTPPAEREKKFEALADRAHKVSEVFAGKPEPMVWEGIILSSWAGEKGGLGALSLVKQAKALYETAIRIDGNALDGSAYNSLGVLYYKVPGWPLGFGDKAKAREMLQKALAINPNGIDPNYFYADFLVQTEEPQKAVAHLEKALQAPARAGRAVADEGRRTEVRQLLDKVKGK